MHINENIRGLTSESEIATVNITPSSISSARKILPRPLPKPQTLAQKQGLRYERKVVKALKSPNLNPNLDIEHNPWFEYAAEGGIGWCVPDILIDFAYVLVVAEVKLTYTPEALEKLNNVYCPVISVATRRKVLPLVIVRNALKPNLLLKTSLDLYDAIRSPFPIYQWLGRYPISAQGEPPWPTAPQTR